MNLLKYQLKEAIKFIFHLTYQIVSYIHLIFLLIHYLKEKNLFIINFLLIDIEFRIPID